MIGFLKNNKTITIKEIIPINKKETEAFLVLILALAEGLLYKIKILFSFILTRLYLLTILSSKLLKLCKFGKIIILETKKGSNLPGSYFRN